MSCVKGQTHGELAFLDVTIKGRGSLLVHHPSEPVLWDVTTKLASCLSHVHSTLKYLWTWGNKCLKIAPFKMSRCTHVHMHAHTLSSRRKEKANSKPFPVPAPRPQAPLASISNKLSCLAGDPLQADKFLLKCRRLVQSYYPRAQVPSCYCKTSKHLIETNDYNNSTLSPQAKRHPSFNY